MKLVKQVTGITPAAKKEIDETAVDYVPKNRTEELGIHDDTGRKHRLDKIMRR